MDRWERPDPDPGFQMRPNKRLKLRDRRLRLEDGVIPDAPKERLKRPLLGAVGGIQRVPDAPNKRLKSAQ